MANNIKMTSPFRYVRINMSVCGLVHGFKSFLDIYYKISLSFSLFCAVVNTDPDVHDEPYNIRSLTCQKCVK